MTCDLHCSRTTRRSIQARREVRVVVAERPVHWRLVPRLASRLARHRRRSSSAVRVASSRARCRPARWLWSPRIWSRWLWSPRISLRWLWSPRISARSPPRPAHHQRLCTGSARHPAQFYAGNADRAPERGGGARSCHPCATWFTAHVTVRNHRCAKVHASRGTPSEQSRHHRPRHLERCAGMKR